MREKLIELINQVQDCGYDMTGVVEMNYIENDTLADYLITNGITMQEWIPVAERLPGKHGTYQIFGYDKDLDRKRVWYGHFFGGRDWFVYAIDGDSMSFDVTHWMPLPQPPKGE